MCWTRLYPVWLPSENNKKSYRTYGLSKVRLLQSLPDFLVGPQVERVNVLSDGAPEDERSLRNDGDVLAQRVQSHFVGVVLSEQVLGAWLRLTDPEH